MLYKTCFWLRFGFIMKRSGSWGLLLVQGMFIRQQRLVLTVKQQDLSSSLEMSRDEEPPQSEASLKHWSRPKWSMIRWNKAIIDEARQWVVTSLPMRTWMTWRTTILWHAPDCHKLPWGLSDYDIILWLWCTGNYGKKTDICNSDVNVNGGTET